MDTGVEPDDRPYTLENYSHDHFRFTQLLSFYHLRCLLLLLLIFCKWIKLLLRPLINIVSNRKQNLCVFKMFANISVYIVLHWLNSSIGISVYCHYIIMWHCRVVVNARPPPKRTLSKQLAGKRRQDELWRHSTEPIKLPLLKKLLDKEDIGQEACLMFLDILAWFSANCHWMWCWCFIACYLLLLLVILTLMALT